MTPIEKLDTVLDFFVSQEIIKAKITIDYATENINKYLNGKYVFDLFEMERIIKKIYKDDYLDYIYKDEDQHRTTTSHTRHPVVLAITKVKVDEYYCISFNGHLFKILGGYNQDQKNKSNLQFLQSLSKWLIVLGTVLAGIGTILLLVWEYWKVNKEHPDWF